MEHFDRNAMTRREMLCRLGELGLFLAATSIYPAVAWPAPRKRGSSEAQREITKRYDLTVAEKPWGVDGRQGKVVCINDSVPGPLLRFREGDEAVIRVTNQLKEDTSIHWHGILLPEPMDGVPGVSFAGIKPGQTFEYRFPIKQSGTYWYHSHSAGQEQEGLYGPIVIDPKEPENLSFDREYVVLLSDWTTLRPMELVAKLKKESGYFNFQKRTVGEFFTDAEKMGLGATISDRLQWAKMRMDPTDFSDITGSTYSFLMNGFSPEGNWSGLFKKGERIRLRFIDGGAMTIFDVRVPGLKMTVVQADGQNVEPVEVEELRIAPGETYDVIVEPTEDKPYAIFAETGDRSGFAMGSLTPKLGLRAPMPPRRKRAARTMADMGMSMGGMEGMDMPGMGKMKMPSQAPTQAHQQGHGGMRGMGESMPSGGPVMKRGSMTGQEKKSSVPGGIPVKHGPDHHGPGNSMTPEETRSRLHEPGTGLGEDGWRVLVYTDLKSVYRWEDQRSPAREIELHLTGNMDRYMWSIDGKKYSEASAPIPFKYGERLRLTFVNDTMMEHPMHLHGMWMYLENGKGPSLPRKHTVVVKPAERLSVQVTADALGDWAFHCHMLFHMEMGMFRVVRVAK
jgi:CopA family copper-resistance protein